MLKRIPLHPLLFAAYPVLALLAHNIHEVEPGAALRPLAAAMGLAIAFMLAGGGVVFMAAAARGANARGATARVAPTAGGRAQEGQPQDGQPQGGRAREGQLQGGQPQGLPLQWGALLATLGLALFFSYGHLYGVLEGAGLLGLNLGRHRFLVPLYLILLIGGSAWILRQGKEAAGRAQATQALNVVGIALLALPLYQIAAYSLAERRALGGGGSPPGAAAPTPGSGAAGGLGLKLPPGDPRDLPDIYYIILDGYTRGDALQRDLGYDNRPFLDELRALGFYVADCSRSNYHFTLGSLTSALNMEYLPDLQDDLWVLLKQNRVRAALEGLGYTTVAFETGYEWSRWEDADIYLGRASQPYALQRITPFEALLVKSSALLPLAESSQQWLVPRFRDVNFPYSDHIDRQLFIFDQIPQIAENPEPTFTFAHILIPHVPYVFAADGSILTDPGYTGGKKSDAIDNAYRTRGYTGQVGYANSRVLPIVRQILARSATPPVIILQGDHGLRKDNRFQILNAYYVSQAARARLDAHITPVNSFRVVLDAYFGADLPRLPDQSRVEGDPPQVVAETAEGCR